GVSPFSQAGLDEALGLAIGLGRVGLSADVLEAKRLAGVAEGVGFIAGAVVGHYAGHDDAEAGVVGDRCLQEGDGAFLLLIGQDLAEGDARGVVDADMDELPTRPPLLAAPLAAGVALAGSIAGDAVTDLVEATELLDVDVDQLAGPLALVAHDRLRRLQVPDPAQPDPPQDAAHRGG